MRILVVIGVLIAILGPQTATAEEAAAVSAKPEASGVKGPPESAEPVPPPSPLNPQTGKDEKKQPLLKKDAPEVGNDRLLLSPTAQTLPEGKNAFSDYELMVLQYRYGITDHLEVALMFSPPVFQISAYPSLKWQVLDTEYVKLALEAHVGETYFYVFSNVIGFMIGGSVVADFCIDKRCGAAITLSAQPDYMTLFSSNGEGTMGMRAALGARFDITKTIKGVLEVFYAGLPQYGKGMLMFNYGIRIHGGQFAGDIGFVRPLFVHDDHDAYGIPKEYWEYVPLGIPWLGLTYQW